MKIIIIGATGFIGKALLQEALSRGHTVTATARNVSAIARHHHVNTIAIDVFDQEQLANTIKGHDIVISAFSRFKSGAAIDEAKNQHMEGVTNIISATKSAGVKRLLVVGGAGSLKVTTGVDLVDTPDFPQQWKENAKSTRDVLNLLKNESELQWTFLSPSAEIYAGTRTGKFRLGSDNLLIDSEGKSEISVEDYAVAMLDEAEKPQHIQKRFTIGY